MRISRVSCLLLAGLALAAPGAFAQKAPDPVKAPPAARAGEGAMPAWIKVSSKDSRLYDVDFPGGTLAEYYRGVSSAPDAKTYIPIVISAEAEKVRFQAISLKDAGVYALYQLPPHLVPGVTLNDAGLTSYKGDDDKEVLVGAYVVGVDATLTRGLPKPAATFNLDFPGGTVADYAAAVRAACPGANIVMLSGAEKASVPAMTFRDVTVEAAMRAIEADRANPDGSRSALLVRGIEIGGSPEGVYKIELESLGQAKSEAVVCVWSLAPMLAAGVKIEDALSAVEAALGVDERPTKIKYHEATNLLIVRATEQQHKLINAVIHEVEHTTSVRRMKEADLKGEGK